MWRSLLPTYDSLTSRLLKAKLLSRLRVRRHDETKDNGERSVHEHFAHTFFVRVLCVKKQSQSANFKLFGALCIPQCGGFSPAIEHD